MDMQVISLDDDDRRCLASYYDNMVIRDSHNSLISNSMFWEIIGNICAISEDDKHLIMESSDILRIKRKSTPVSFFYLYHLIFDSCDRDVDRFIAYLRDNDSKMTDTFHAYSSYYVVPIIRYVNDNKELFDQIVSDMMIEVPEIREEERIVDPDKIGNGKKLIIAVITEIVDHHANSYHSRSCKTPDLSELSIHSSIELVNSIDELADRLSSMTVENDDASDQDISDITESVMNMKLEDTKEEPSRESSQESDDNDKSVEGTSNVQSDSPIDSSSDSSSDDSMSGSTSKSGTNNTPEEAADNSIEHVPYRVCVKAANLRKRYDIELVKFWVDEDHLYIDNNRPASGVRSSIWSNPFKGKRGITIAESLDKYRDMMVDRHRNNEIDLKQLKGKALGTWTDENRPCHADVLIELYQYYCT